VLASLSLCLCLSLSLSLSFCLSLCLSLSLSVSVSLCLCLSLSLSLSVSVPLSCLSLSVFLSLSVSLFVPPPLPPPPPSLSLSRALITRYENSVQELLYITGIQAEQSAFRNLINEHARVVLPEQLFPAKSDGQLSVDGSGSGSVRSSTSLGGSSAAVSTRVGGGLAAPRAADKIVIDMREFRSALPSILHARGFQIVPITLEVGDYVLSPELCVERKSISDLYGSFRSGRLHTQAMVMCRHYKNPILLIEFDENRAFGFQSSARLGDKVGAQDITSKLVLLTRHFPRLRLVWSASPHATVDFFQCLKKTG
jgi:DNA excision repair protein ERCC-4